MNSEAQEEKQKSLLKSGFFWLWTIVLSIAIGSSLFYFTQYRDVPLRIDVASSMYTQPLDEDGQVDYIAVLRQMSNFEDLASEKNGFRLLIEKVDWTLEIEPSNLDHMRSQLGIDDANLAQTLSFESPSEFAFKYFSSKEFDKELIQKLEQELDEDADPPGLVSYDMYDVEDILMTRAYRPWTEKDLPPLHSWLEKNNAALDVAAKSIRYPVFKLPFICRSGESSLFNLRTPAFLRSLARGFNVRATYWLGQGEIRKAIDDVITIKRLGRLCRNDVSYHSNLLGIAIEGVANSVGFAIAGKYGKEDLEYFVAELDALPLPSDISPKILYSKLEMIEFMRDVALSKDETILEFSKGMRRIRKLGLNWNVVSIEFQRLFDENFGERVASVEGEFERVSVFEILSRNARSKSFARFINSFTDFSSGWIEAEKRMRCGDNLQRITIAMLRYELEHGHLPPAYTTDEAGNPLHSWRVLLLPYLGQKDLHKQIRLDEPWNSPHNSEFADKVPEVYACPSCTDCSSGHTSYSVVVGPTKVPFFENRETKLDQYGPEADDMVLVAERVTPINWMIPNREISHAMALEGINLENEALKSEDLVGSAHPYISQFGFRDGSVNSLSESLELDDMKDIIEGTNPRYIPR